MTRQQSLIHLKHLTWHNQHCSNAKGTLFLYRDVVPFPGDPSRICEQSLRHRPPHRLCLPPARLHLDVT